MTVDPDRALAHTPDPARAPDPTPTVPAPTRPDVTGPDLAVRPPAVGDELELTVTGVAHGGSCVARHQGQVVFVRHTLPGERVRARITGSGGGGSYLRADAVDVLVAAPGRVDAPCPFSGPGKCGGCDWQHASLPTQRELKAAVVAEQLSRLAGIEWSVAVERVPFPGETPPVVRDDGLGWRTRMRLRTDGGRLGLREHGSHRLVPVDDCPIADVRLGVSHLALRRWRGRTELSLAIDARGHRYAAVDGAMRPGSAHHLVEQAAGRAWRVDGTGFWQVHPGAPAVLIEAVREALAPRPGESALDLYSGVGLFAGVLADDVGPSGTVDAVEGDAGAVANARRNLQGLRTVTIWAGDVEEVLTTPDAVPAHVDVVVLDPPRTGARAAVVDAVASRRPRAIAYVACDPAALARDVATFTGHGYVLTSLRAFDLFPMTHHVECVALLEPADRPAHTPG